MYILLFNSFIKARVQWATLVAVPGLPLCYTTLSFHERNIGGYWKLQLQVSLHATLLDNFINLILESPIRCSLRSVRMQLVHAGMSEVCITAT